VGPKVLTFTGTGYCAMNAGRDWSSKVGDDNDVRNATLKNQHVCYVGG
jgi:hypothetical protein